MRRFLTAAAALVGGLLVAVAQAADPAPTPVGEVKVRDGVVLELRRPLADQSAADRARDATRALARALEDPAAGEVRVEEQAGSATVLVGAVPVLTLGPDDALAAGDPSLAVHAANAASRLGAAVQSERRRASVARGVFSGSLVVFLGLLAVLTARKLGELGENARRWLIEHPDRIPRISLRDIELARPSSVRSALLVALGVTRLGAQLGVMWAWLVFSLSLFESTRDLGQRLSAALLTPLVALAGRLATALPVVVVIALGVLAVGVLLRFIGLFFESIARGENQLDGVPADLARPTGALLRLGVVLVALTVVAPLVTGDDGGVLPRLGLAGVVALGLSSVPALASVVVGVALVFGRRVVVGQRVALGAHSGRVVQLGLLGFGVASPDGTATRLPWLLCLREPLVTLPGHPRVEVEVVLPREALTPEARGALVGALAAVGEAPQLEVLELGPREVRLRVSVESEAPDARARLGDLLCDQAPGGGAA